MAKPPKCTTTSPEIEAANSHINEKIQQIEDEIDSILDADFGRVFNNTSTLRNSIKELTIFIRNSTSEMNSLRKLDPKKESLRQKIKKAQKDLNKAKKSLKEFKQKEKIANDILFHQGKDDKPSYGLKPRLMMAAQLHHWNIDVPAIVGALKSALTTRTGPFQSINELSMLELRVKKKQLIKWFKEQDKGIVPKAFKGQGIVKALEYSLMDPAKVVLMNDPSLKAVSLLKEVHDILPKKSKRKVKMKSMVNKSLLNLADIIYDGKIVYGIDPVNPEELTKDEAAENERKILELMADLLDGRTKYVVPRMIQQLIASKKHLLPKYAKIIEYANNSGFNISKDIHEIEVGDEVFYYITIKNVNEETGQETYNAFLAPHYIDDNGRTKFYYPYTKKGKLSGNFLTALSDIIGKNKTGKDLTDIMTSGFRQAQVDKIFNGYNKREDEINVKGYANYALLQDLDINHPLFQEVRIRKASKTQDVLSLWSIIQEQRSILEEIFNDWQDLSKQTLLRVEKVMNNYPQLKEHIISKGNTPEEADEYLTRIINILDFRQFLYVDKNGNVQSPNITAGIDENYFPTQFSMHDDWANRIKAISEMMNEAGLLADKQAQLKNLDTSAVDMEEKRSIKKQLVKVDQKLKELVGYKGLDGQWIPGTIEIMREELKLSLGLIAPEDMPRITAQSMISYGKHRKLYTKRIMDLTPGTKHGGKRTDRNVINSYIDILYETIYNNE